MEKNDTTTIMLLRGQSFRWIEEIASRDLPPTELAQVLAPLATGLRFQQHVEADWTIELAPDALALARLTESSGRAPQGAVRIKPWGADFSGLMISITSSKTSAEWLAIEFKCHGLNDLVVSRYSSDDLAAQNFRGAVFERDAEDRGLGVWEASATPNGSAIVFRVGHAQYLPANAQIIARGTGDPHLIECIEIFDASALQHFTHDLLTLLITSGDISRSVIGMAINDPESVDDRLRFSLGALTSARWIYLHATERCKNEIYISNDPLATGRLLRSPLVMNSRSFLLNCFC